LGYQDEAFMNSLWRMFEQAIEILGELPQAERDPFLARLHKVRHTAEKCGFGLGDLMEDLLREHEDKPSKGKQR
jgi:hypothetical protein